MIRFSCPACRAVLEVADSGAASKLPCPKCGQRLQVPTPPPNKTILAPLVSHQPGVPAAPTAIPLPPTASSIAAPAAIPVTPTAPPAASAPPPTVPVVAAMPAQTQPPPMPARQPAHYQPPAAQPPAESSRAGCYMLAFILALVLFIVGIATNSRHSGFGPSPGAFLIALGFLVLFALYIATLIELAVWIARDARSRGMGEPALWLLLVVFLHLMGFIIFLACRPQGNLVRCQECGNPKLPYHRLCPHCGSERARMA